MKYLTFILFFFSIITNAQVVIKSNNGVVKTGGQVRIGTTQQAFPEIEFYAPASNGPESQATRNVVVNLSETSNVDISVDVTISGTATGGGVDHTTANGTITILAGNLSGSFDIIGIVDDAIPENTNPDETVVLTLSNPTNAVIGVNATFTYYINDNDSPPVVEFSLPNSNGPESTSNANLGLVLSTTSVLNVDVDFTVTGSATGNGTDYTLANGTATIFAGNTTTNIPIAGIVDDALDEGNETVVVTISNPTNATLGNELVHTYTIIDNDGSPTLEFTVTSSSGLETVSSAFIEVSQSFVSSSDVDVDYSVNVASTATGGGTDYTLANGTATITAGNLSTNITISGIVDDAIDEGNETIIVDLSNPSGATLGANTTHTYTILDNDSSDTFVACTAGGGETYNPASQADIENPANAGKTAVITNSFSCTNCTFASGQTIVPSGGIISGTNINLNGACIIDDFSQLFSANITFNTPYNNSRLSPEAFGATANDAGDDTSAINTLVRQSEYAISSLNGSYVKNSPTNYNRPGVFSWDMNGGKVEVTNTANYDLTKVSIDAVFDMTNVSPTIFNGEFDGNDLYGRFFYLHGQNHFSFRNLWVHDLYSPNAIRAVAFRFSINVNGSGFTSGEFLGNTIEDIVAQGDGNYNDGGGIAKAWWYTLSGITSSSAFEVNYKDNVVRNIIGDDAEGFYAIGGASVSHNCNFTFDNEDYRYCTRRAIKACVSNVEIKNSYFEEIPQSMFNSAQQMGSMLDFFSTSSGNLIEDIWVHDNTIRTVPGSDPHYYLLAVTDAKDVIIEDNTFTSERLTTYGTIRLGSNTSTYSGDLQDIIIRRNILNNGYVQAMLNYDPLNPVDLNNMTYNWTSTKGSDIAAFRFYGSGTKGNVNFTNSNINANLSTTSGIRGVISADAAVTGITNFNINNVAIDYQNAVPTYAFGYINANFNNTNTIQNSTLIGNSGANSLQVTGTGGVVITNSFGDGSTPITEN